MHDVELKEKKIVERKTRSLSMALLKSDGAKQYRCGFMFDGTR